MHVLGFFLSLNEMETLESSRSYYAPAEATMPHQKLLRPSHQNNLSNGAWGFGLELLGTEKCLSVIELYFLILT